MFGIVFGALDVVLVGIVFAFCTSFHIRVSWSFLGLCLASMLAHEGLSLLWLVFKFLDVPWLLGYTWVGVDLGVFFPFLFEISLKWA